MDETVTREITLDIDVGAALKPSVAKLTRTKRKKVLQNLAQGWNLTKAAQSVGVTRQAVQDLIARDEKFSNAYRTVLDAHVDLVEETTFVVACDPSPRGYNDRRQVLEAHRRETYGKKVEMMANHNINISLSVPELNRILQGQNVQAESEPEAIPEAEVIEILPK